MQATNAIDVKMANIHWAESAVKQLDEEISFIVAEEARLLQEKRDSLEKTFPAGDAVLQ